MPHEQELVERVRRTLSVYQERTERKMFGGLAFMLRGNMCCGVHGDELILRLNEELARQALTRRHVRRFDLGGPTRAQHGDGRRGRMPDRRGGGGLGAPSG